MDWTKCILCGKIGGDLRCPLDSLQGNGLEVYSKFLETLKQFKELDALPMETKIYTEEVTAQMMVENRGNWHRSCYLNSNKLFVACVILYNY